MTVIAVQRIKNGVPTSADTASLSIANSAGATVLDPTVIDPTEPGMYSYSTSALLPGSFTATWTFTTYGLPVEVVARAFVVDAPIELSEGITLMQLEQLIARRVGPFKKCHTIAGSTQNQLFCRDLKSSLGLGSYEDQYILRRGLTPGDELVTNFDADDRVRQVSQYDPNLGTLFVDQAYDHAPLAGEAFELHALHPEDELRPAAIDGLRRCFFWDTVLISVTGSTLYNIDLTAAMPWLGQASWIREVGLSYPSQRLPPTRLGWWEVYRQGKGFKLWTRGGAVGNVMLSVLRPAFSLVNSEMSLTGPNDDFDTVYVDPDYAAWAGVLELWKTIPEVLMPLAAQNMRASRDDAAKEFTKKSLTLVEQVPERLQLDFGHATDLEQIGNLAEPVT